MQGVSPLSLKYQSLQSEALSNCPALIFDLKHKMSRRLESGKGAGSSSIDLRYIKFLRINVDKMQIL